MKLYITFTKKIYNSTNDPEIKLLILLNYRDDDLFKSLKKIKKYLRMIQKRISENDIDGSYYYIDKLKDEYNKFEIKIKERINFLVKIRAFDLAKNSKVH